MLKPFVRDNMKGLLKMVYALSPTLVAAFLAYLQARSISLMVIRARTVRKSWRSIDRKSVVIDRSAVVTWPFPVWNPDSWRNR